MKHAKIITFYSFKGGVGRTRALANVAYQLAQRGKGVLCVDFDLEAPGLHWYFAKWLQTGKNKEFLSHPGLIDLFCSYKDFLLSQTEKKELLHWKNLVQKVRVTDAQKNKFTIDFIGPGIQDHEYGNRVAGFEWNNFYEHWEGGRFIDYLRKEFLDNYEYVLIDSRTGFSDVGGICTLQFPDIVVGFFSHSPQSMEGLEKIFRIIAKNQGEKGSNEKPVLIPLSSHVDRKEERYQYDLWFSKIVEGYFAELISQLKLDFSPPQILRRTSLEYFPFYSFNDTLESEKEDLDDEGFNAWKYSNLIDIIQKL